MEKVLLIGELNQTVSSVNRYLSTRFQIRMCADEPEQVEAEAAEFEPDLVVVSLIGIGELDTAILDIFVKNYPMLPVLLLGTVEECKAYESYYERRQFDFAVRPITLSAFMRKCMSVLHISAADSEEYRQAMQEGNEKKRILAVDDSGVLLRSVKTILEKKYWVSVATSGKMAIKQAKKVKPDLILLDYEMPEWDGKRTFEEIQQDEELKDVPVVFLTGVSDRSHIMAVLKLNPAGYLLKPIEQDRLLETIYDVLTGIV